MPDLQAHMRGDARQFLQGAVAGQQDPPIASDRPIPAADATFGCEPRRQVSNASDELQGQGSGLDQVSRQ
jgi:hypothetical protein